MVQPHQLVKLNYRCRIHSESFIASHCPPWSPTASSLFSCGALLEICSINVIAGDSLTQSSDFLKKTLLRSMATATIFLLWRKDYSDTLREKRSFFLCENLSNYFWRIKHSYNRTKEFLSIYDGFVTLCVIQGQMTTWFVKPYIKITD